MSHVIAHRRRTQSDSVLLFFVISQHPVDVALSDTRAPRDLRNRSTSSLKRDHGRARPPSTAPSQPQRRRQQDSPRPPRAGPVHALHSDRRARQPLLVVQDAVQPFEERMSALLGRSVVVTHIGDRCRAAGFLPIAMPSSLGHTSGQVDSDLRLLPQAARRRPSMPRRATQSHHPGRTSPKIFPTMRFPLKTNHSLVAV